MHVGLPTTCWLSLFILVFSCSAQDGDCWSPEVRQIDVSKQGCAQWSRFYWTRLESGFQRARKQLKTRDKLEHMLYAVRQRQWEWSTVGCRAPRALVCHLWTLRLGSWLRATVPGRCRKFSICCRRSNDRSDSTIYVHMLTPRLPQFIFVLLAFCARLSKHYSCLSDGDLWCKCEECILLSRDVYTAARRTIQRLRLCKKIVTNLPGGTVPLSLFNDNDGYSSLWWI